MLGQHKLLAYLRLMRFDKPIGIYLLLWPTLWALWLAAKGKPALPILLIFMAGVVLMRACGCVINDIADRKFDGHVQRTANRPLVLQEVSVRQAWGLVFILLVLACVLLLQLNRLTWPVAWLAVGLTLIYPFCKRVTFFPQVVLGASFACTVPMAFFAQAQQFPLAARFLFILVLLWVVAYDTMYAMADREEDKRIGLKSTAILLANYDRLLLAVVQACIVLGLLGLGCYLAMPLSYYVAWVVAVGLVCYQQYLLRDRVPAACFQAFLNNHWFGLVIFLGIFFSYY
jgi:4-hydroxybenzoate polyprenyltransferase